MGRMRGVIEEPTGFRHIPSQLTRTRNGSSSGMCEICSSMRCDVYAQVARRVVHQDSRLAEPGGIHIVSPAQAYAARGETWVRFA